MFTNLFGRLLTVNNIAIETVIIYVNRLISAGHVKRIKRHTPQIRFLVIEDGYGIVFYANFKLCTYDCIDCSHAFTLDFGIVEVFVLYTGVLVFVF